MKRIVAVFGIFLLFVAGAVAQAYEGHGRDPAEFDAALKNLKPGSLIGSLDDSGTGSFNAWCSSFLAPDVKAPVDKPDYDDDLNEFQFLLDQWSCMYSPERLRDGDAKTAWVEGVSGEGIGETVIVHIDVSVPVKIWAGLGSSPEMFRANCRPRRVLVSVLRAEGGSATQMGVVYQSIKVLAQGETELKDFYGFQSLTLPAFSFAPDAGGSLFMAIKILSVYPGTKYKDTCISELTN